jgi:hypothetical protein
VVNILHKEWNLLQPTMCRSKFFVKFVKEMVIGVFLSYGQMSKSFSKIMILLNASNQQFYIDLPLWVKIPNRIVVYFHPMEFNYFHSLKFVVNFLVHFHFK